MTTLDGLIIIHVIIFTVGLIMTCIFGPETVKPISHDDRTFFRWREPFIIAVS